MADFAWSDLALLWPLLPFIGAALFAWGWNMGYRESTRLSAHLVNRQRKEIEAYHREINTLIDRLPPHERPNRPGVYLNVPETEH